LSSRRGGGGGGRQDADKKEEDETLGVVRSFAERVMKAHNVVAHN
jgi:hypothetical protein